MERAVMNRDPEHFSIDPGYVDPADRAEYERARDEAAQERAQRRREAREDRRLDRDDNRKVTEAELLRGYDADDVARSRPVPEKLRRDLGLDER